MAGLGWSRLTFHVSFFGGHKAVVRPDPIPNSAVKHSLADGSSPIGSARVGSRQSFNKPGEFSPGFLLSLPILIYKTGLGGVYLPNATCLWHSFFPLLPDFFSLSIR